jgi:hypothetical protein
MSSVHSGADGRIEVFDDSWPIVIVEWHGVVTPEMVEHAFKTHLTLARRAREGGEQIAWLTDLSHFDPLKASAADRKRAALVLAEHQPAVAPHTLAEARVASRAVVRGVLTAMTWLVRDPWPVKIVAARDEGLTWLQKQRGA